MTRVHIGLGPLSAQAIGGDPAATSAELDALIDAVTAAERCGFDAVWLSEHHLTDDGYLTSPLMLLAALSRVTTTIGLGTAVALAPLYEPLRLAEESTLLDHLSDGRLLLGLGTGYRDVELEGFRVPPGDRTKRLIEVVGVLRSVWADGTIMGVTVTPRPRRPLGPPILLGGFVETAVRRAGRLGDGWIAPAMARPEQLEQRLEWLAQECALDRPFHVVINVATVVGHGDAWAVAGRGVRHVEDRYRTWAGRASDGRRPSNVVVGSPNACLEALAPWRDLIASLPNTVKAHLNLRLHYPGMGRAVAVDAVELAGSALIPHLRSKES